jgi:putative flavoprotein involved in K+ transport
MTLVGRAESCRDDVMRFAPDLAANLARGDADYLGLLDQCDAYIARNGLDLPEEPEARRIAPDPQCVTEPILELDLKQAGIATIVWATGFVQDFSWIKLDAFDAQGQPKHRRGVSPVQGLYFLGLPWLSRRGSSFIWGVWHDARYIADQIGIQRSYLAYDAQARARAEADAPAKAQANR